MGEETGFGTGGQAGSGLERCIPHPGVGAGVTVPGVPLPPIPRPASPTRLLPEALPSRHRPAGP